MTLETAKTLTGIGALLLVVGSFVPFLSVVGIILFYVGLKGLGEAYNDRSIFHDAFYALIFGIIGALFVGVGLLSIFFGVFSYGSLGILGFSVLSIVFFVVAFVFYILMAMYFRRCFDVLATRSGVGLFRTAGTLLLIGAILTIIVVGLILVFIAWILVTAAVFSIPTTSMQSQSQMPPPPPMS